MLGTKKWSLSLAATACTMMCTVAFAADSASHGKAVHKSPSKATQQWIDDLSSKVNLSDDQKDQIREKLNDNSDKIESTWRKFANANAKAIELEASMYAAIEESMDDGQKQQFRDQHESHKQQTNSSHGHHDTASTMTTGNRHSDSHATSATAASNSTTNAQSQQDTTHRWAQDEDKNASQRGQDDAAYYYVTEMIIVPVQETVEDVAVSGQQRQQCDKACQEFESKLHQAWSDVYRYHDQLVELEAQKMRSVEAVLDKDQLQQLKANRKSGQSS